jgi:hypothetical protein
MIDASPEQEYAVQLSRLDRVAYRTQHLSFLVNATLLQETARVLSRAPRPKMAQPTWRALRRRHEDLHARDLANVEAGLYPRDLLFQIPVAEYMRAFPSLVLDAPRVVRRMRRGAWKDIPKVDKRRFPAYYRRNFHWQTDGYFSSRSARLYDLGVEILFRGTADVMRRQVIPPITRFLGERGPGARLLDVACGTGRTLRQIAVAHPGLALAGVDLSPFSTASATSPTSASRLRAIRTYAGDRSTPNSRSPGCASEIWCSVRPVPQATSSSRMFEPCSRTYRVIGGMTWRRITSAVPRNRSSTPSS